MRDKSRIIKAITVMLEGFQSQNGSNPDIKLQSYLLAVDGLRTEAVEEACLRFNRGQVQAHDGRYAPTTAQLAREARNREELMVMREEAASRPRLAPPLPDTSPKIGPEKMQALRQALRTGDWSELASHSSRKH